MNTDGTDFVVGTLASYERQENVLGQTVRTSKRQTVQAVSVQAAAASHQGQGIEVRTMDG
jgi:hypothetical protein